MIGHGYATLAPMTEVRNAATSRPATEPVLTADELVRLTAGTMLKRSSRPVRGAAVDSRLVHGGELFVALSAFVMAGESAEPFTTPAARLGMTTHAFTVALHRLRQRVGHRLRADVAETVAHESDVDEELRHLIAAVSGRASAR